MCLFCALFASLKFTKLRELTVLPIPLVQGRGWGPCGKGRKGERERKTEGKGVRGGRDEGKRRGRGKEGVGSPISAPCRRPG